jgi:hypothetical protein
MWIEMNRENKVGNEEVLSWTLHICLKYFRLDVLNDVDMEIKEEKREERDRKGASLSTTATLSRQ